MSRHVTRDPETGAVRINGRVGLVLAFLDALAPAMRTLVVVGMVGLCGWVYYIDRTVGLISPEWVKGVDDFMVVGDRVIPEHLEQAVDGLRTELLTIGQLPMADKRLSDLEGDIAEIKGDVKANSISLATVRADLAAVRRILEK